MTFESFSSAFETSEIPTGSPESAFSKDTFENNEVLLDDNETPYRTSDGDYLPNNEFELDGINYKTDDSGNIYQADGEYYPNDFFVLNGILYMTDENGAVLYEPNSTYESDGNICETDDNGKTYKVNGELMPRNTYELNGNTYSTDDNGTVYKENGKFIPNNEYTLNGNEYKTNEYGERFPQSPEGYERPHLRNDVVAAIYANAPKDKQGRYLDPNTGRPIEGRPDIGHKPGHEHRREREKAFNEGLSQEQFNDRMNNPDYYQLEDPSNNRSHKYEDKSEYEGA